MAKMRSLFMKLLRRRNLHQDLEAELAHHRELASAHGNSIGLGNTTILKEQALDLWRFTWIENRWRDLRYALRGLRRNPGFAITAGLSLSLGIGITTTMFTLLNAAAFRPLPYPDADRVVWLTQVLKANTIDEITMTPYFLVWQKDNHSFTDLAAYNYVDRALSGVSEPVEVHTVKSSAALLRLLGEQPFLGRRFSREEDYAGNDHVAILSYPTWQAQFGGNRAVIGRPVILDGEQYSIVGILPPDFVFPGPDPVDIMTPLGKDEAGELAFQRTHVVTVVHNVIGRLKPDVSREQARAEIAVIQSHLPLPPWRPTVTIKMLPLRDFLFGNAKTAGFLLVAGSMFFLLITSANVGSLLLVRLMQRDRELAVRSVLGGSRRRILAQLLTENALLSVLACGAGILLAWWIRRPLLAFSPYRLSGLTLPFDARVLAFAVILSVLTVLAFGLTPALRATGVRLSEAIKAGQSSIMGVRETLRKLSAIAVCEIAAVLVLSASAALMLQSFWNMRYANLGFQSNHAVAATINLVQSHYRERQQRLAFIDELLERAKMLPGVDSVALTRASEIPPGGGHATNTFQIEGRPFAVDSRQKPIARSQMVNVDYFRILHIPLVAGRLLQDSDRDNTMPVAVVNRALATRYFPHESPIGHHIQAGQTAHPWANVVGVVGDVKTSGLAAAPEPAIYYPYAQTDGMTDIGVIMQSALRTETIANQFRKMIATLDPAQPVAKIETLDQRLNESVSKPRFTTSLLFAFACLATLLGMIGVYGVMSCRVNSQIREIAVRQAVGAQPRDVVSHVLRQCTRILLPGLLIGLAGSMMLTRFLSTMLYEIRPNDPHTLVVVSLGIVAVSLAACSLPAIRAARVDPLVSLRQE